MFSYRETVHHHIVSTLANLETLRVNREKILNDYLEDRRWAVNETDPNAGIFLLPPCEDTSRWKRLAELINERFAAARDRYTELESRTDYVRDVLAEGGRKAREIAEATMSRVREACGIVTNR